MAFRLGMRAAVAAGADIVVHVDADGQYLPSDLRPLMIPVIRGDQDLIIGNRLRSKPACMTGCRYVQNSLLSKVVSILAGCQIPDSQCGFRVLSREVAECDTLTNNFTYTQDQCLEVARRGFRIGSVPIGFVARQQGRSRLVKSAWNYGRRVAPTLHRRVAIRRGTYVDFTN
jgi:hypothetical protein